MSRGHCERSEAISLRLRPPVCEDCFVALCAPRNDNIRRYCERSELHLAEQRELFVFAHGLERMQRIAGRGLRPFLRRRIGLDRRQGFRIFGRRFGWRCNEIRLRQHGGLRRGGWRRRGIEQERRRVGLRLGAEQEIGRIEIGFRRRRAAMSDGAGAGSAVGSIGMAGSTSAAATSTACAAGAGATAWVRSAMISAIVVSAAVCANTVCSIAAGSVAG